MSVTRTDFLAPVQADLDEFERRLHDIVRADMGPLADAMQQILHAGGKRIRPALVLLAAHLGRPRIEDVFRSAMAIEFIHSATLIHDDLIDHAPTRRGLPTIHEVLGPGPAVIIGDYYFAKAANLMAQIGDSRIDALLSQAVMTICYGEMLQFTSQRKYDQTVEEYYEKIGRKTAVLMAASTFCGAMTSEQTDEAAETLRRYGHLLGMAFQIADDVLDYLATEAEVGKPVGNDLKEGTVTLPLMLALQDPGVDGRLRRVLDRPKLTDADYKEVVLIVRDSRAIDEAYEYARRFAEEARQVIAAFPSSFYKDALEELTHYVVRRRN